jgi:hypothetical protein
VELSAYVYPWDILNIGVEKAFQEFTALGLDSIDLTSNYHPIATLSPRVGPRRSMYIASGAVFFEPNPARYADISPSVWPDSEITGVWPAVVREARRRDLRVDAWSIALFQPWITEKCPEVARVLPTGDRVSATACPAAPQVRALITALACDLLDQFDVEMVQLEGMAYPSGTYGWVRPRLLMPMSPFANWLLSCCFCPHCRRAMRLTGLDDEEVRRLILGLLEAEMTADPVDPAPWPQRLNDIADKYPELPVLLSQYRNNVVEFVTQVADGMAEIADHRLSLWSPVDGHGGEGVSLDRVADRLGGLQLLTALGPDVAVARNADRYTGERRLRVTTLLPNPWDAPTADLSLVEAELYAAIERGVDRLAIYQLGGRNPDEVAKIASLVSKLAR